MSRTSFSEAERVYAPFYRLGAAIEDELLARLDVLFAAPSEPPAAEDDEPPSTMPAREGM